MPSFNNVATTNAYQEFRFPRTQRVTIAVSNAPVLARFAVVTPPGTLRDTYYDFQAAERDMANGVAWGWTPDDFPEGNAIVGIMVKSEILNTPAIITIHA